MANRTPRHLRPGQQNLRGKKTARICPCCDDMKNHKEKIIEKIHNAEIALNRNCMEAEE